jgi:hypothetical protein
VSEPGYKNLPGIDLFMANPNHIHTSSKKIPHRAVIYSKDVENITGGSRRAAQRLIQNIYKAFGKPKHQFITIQEFCEYTGMEEELVRDFLAD